jgi:hypothetical protein
MITLGPALFDNNNRLISLNRGYKNMHYLTQFIVTTFYMYKKQHNFIIIIIFLHGLGRLTCSGIDALPSFPTGYAGGNFMFLVGPPKPDRP